MYNKLLREIIDFRKYNFYLDDELYEVYKDHLNERILKEITISTLADNFRSILNQGVDENTGGATIKAVDKLANFGRNTKYERKFGEVIPNSRTHLETTSGKFCNKKTFVNEFKKEDFSDIDVKEDLPVKGCINTMLDRYLGIYNDGGWLISKVDEFDNV